MTVLQNECNYCNQPIFSGQFYEHDSKGKMVHTRCAIDREYHGLKKIQKHLKCIPCGYTDTDRFEYENHFWDKHTEEIEEIKNEEKYDPNN